MSLITPMHSSDKYETRFIGCGGDCQEWITQYIQYFNGKPIARFKVIEPKRLGRIRLYKTPLDHLRHIWA